MLDLEQQLHDYGTFLDGLEPEPVVVASVAHRNRSRLVAAAVAAVLLVGGGIAVTARRDASDSVTIRGAGRGDTTTTQTSDSAIVTAKPTFAQQVAQLERWYAHAVADAPGGRPILNSEYEVCDYRGAPELGSDVQGGFASYFPLAQPLTAARLVEGCLHRDDIPKGIPTTSQLCSTSRRGPVYDAATPHKVFTKPVVVFGSTECAAAGFGPFTPAFLDSLNHRRRIEIEMWAVPRSCPTQEEATQWVEKISGQRTPRAWTVVGPPPMHANTTTLTVPPGPPAQPSDGSCVRPFRIDWDLQRVTLERF